RGQIAALNLRLLVAAASRTICVTDAERSTVVDIVGEAGGESLEVVPLGVEPQGTGAAEERSAARSALDVHAQLVVAMVGALEYPKDPVTAARAAVEVAGSGLSLTLLVVGEGCLRAQVED